VESAAGRFALPRTLALVVDGGGDDAERAFARLREVFRAAGCALRRGDARPGRPAVRVRCAPDPAIPPQGYRLEVSADGVRISASAPAGVFHAAMTLRQMLAPSSAGGLPACRIEDAPALEERGVMLDISRDKVPTMETLLDLVDTLASLKINRLELYTEHTFAYRRHRVVWAEASPMTAADIRRLDAWCRDRFVELVPNQNSFGHMERWMKHEPYHALAECPDGFTPPWSRTRHPPCTLDPTNPGSLALIAELYDELLPNFTSRKFNVGGDETWELGQGRSKALCERVGKGRVYLDFLLKIHEHVQRHGRVMQFWGDIILHSPELIPEIPKDVVPLAWGYDEDFDFAAKCESFRASGLRFLVCPGTSSWNSIAGRTDNMVANIRRAAAEGARCGASGLLNTDWGDNGHWQYLPVSWLPFAVGAAAGWSGVSFDAGAVRRAVDAHVFRDAAGVMGGVAADLGNAYLHTGKKLHNKTVLFGLLLQPEVGDLLQGVTVEALRGTEDFVKSAAARLAGAAMARPDAALVTAEFEQAARMLSLACRRGMAILEGRDGEAAWRRGAAAELDGIIEEHRRLWLARNRPGGLRESEGRLRRLREKIGGA
jgi:hypothetical protein